MNRDSLASPRGAAALDSSAQRPSGLPSAYRELAQLAASICGTPAAAVVLPGLGEARVGEPFAAADAAGAAGAVGLSASARGYAACALRADTGEVIGTLAVHDSKPRRFSKRQLEMLAALARQCSAQAALRARIAELEILSPLPQAPLPQAPPPQAAPNTHEHSMAAQLADSLLDSAPVAIYYADSSSAITYVNSEYRRMFGLSPQQSSDDWAQGVHPEDRQRVETTWQDFRRNPRPLTFEYRAQLAAGPVRFYAERVLPTPWRSGYVGTISDLTELVNARGELHRAETLLRNTFAQAPIGIAYADRSGKLLEFNAAFCALLDYDPAELVGSPMSRLTHPDDVETRQLERLWRGEVRFLDAEKRYRRKDGTYLWVRTTTGLVRDGSRADRSVEYLRDITQRKDLAAQLIQQATLLEAVIGELPVALLACGVEGQITHYNRAAVELGCIHRSDGATAALLDRHAQTADVYLMDGATSVPAQEQPLARALRGETISNLELIVKPEEATPRTTLSSARRLIGPDGQTLGAVAVIQDMTERKRQEVELERVHKELMTASREAGMAEVATNVLHNVGNILNSVNISASLVAERLRQSKASGISRLAALLDEQGESVGRFITEDERGKRVPEYLGALGERLDADRRAALEELALLRENLEHIKDTVTMQQSYAKLCGVAEIVEVAGLVEDSLRLNAGAFARHGVMIQREFSQVPKINVDKHKVLQILVNLVRNAKYACDDSGRTDKRIVLRVEPAPSGVRISVADNGIGIAPDNLGKLFRHGFTTRASGHGFGLHSGAIAAQELGGTLRAESEGSGRGATFILELPLSAPPGALS